MKKSQDEAEPSSTRTSKEKEKPKQEDSVNENDLSWEESSSSSKSTSSNSTKISSQIQLQQNQQARLDKFLTLYSKWCASSTLSERGIKLLQWTIWLLSQLVKNRQEYSKDLSPSLRAVYSELTTMRYILRLYGMPTALDGIRNYGSWATGGSEWKDKRIAKLGHVMAWSMLVYYPLEHVALVKWRMPKIFPNVNANRFSAWSCRFWLSFIIADWISSFLKNRELLEQRKKLMSGSSLNKEDIHDGDDNDEVTQEVKALDKSIYMNKLQILRCILFTPPCISWSLPKWAEDPLFSENVNNGFSFVESIVCMHQSITNIMG